MAQKTLERPWVLEGTGEEVGRQIGDLAGQRVKVFVYTEGAADAEPEESAPRNLAEWLAPLLEEADRLVSEEPVPHTDPHEIAFGETLEEKYREGRL
jgi:hypothetical protein